MRASACSTSSRADTSPDRTNPAKVTTESDKKSFTDPNRAPRPAGWQLDARGATPADDWRWDRDPSAARTAQATQ
ncbi:MAG: hypothetical protein NVS3B21_20460 [Acidimicrobiales bacterium]